MSTDTSEAICCPKFNPEPWDGQLLSWDKKKFIKGRVRTFLFMPLNFGSVISNLDRQAREAGAELEDNLCLSDHTSRWNMDIYLAVNKEVPGANNIELSGQFLSKVYEGPFQDTGKWCQDFEQYADKEARQIKKQYMWYTTCPKCAKKYGKNYTVILGEVN